MPSSAQFKSLRLKTAVGEPSATIQVWELAALTTSSSCTILYSSMFLVGDAAAHSLSPARSLRQSVPDSNPLTANLFSTGAEAKPALTVSTAPPLTSSEPATTPAVAPRPKTTTRSIILSHGSILCSTKTKVAPVFCRTCFVAATICRTPSGSKLAVGSSKSKIRGCIAKAPAKAKRCI